MITLYPQLQVSYGMYVQKFRSRQVVFVMNETTRSRLTMELCGADRLMALFEVSQTDRKMNRIFNCPVEINNKMSDNNVILRDTHRALSNDQVAVLNNLMDQEKDGPDDFAHAWPSHYE